MPFGSFHCQLGFLYICYMYIKLVEQWQQDACDIPSYVLVDRDPYNSFL